MLPLSADVRSILLPIGLTLRTGWGTFHGHQWGRTFTWPLDSTCGSCMDARGYRDADLGEGICRSSMPQLAEWTIWAHKVVTF